MRVKAKPGRCAVVRIPIQGDPFIEQDDLDGNDAVRLAEDMNRASGEPRYCLFIAVNDEGGPEGPRITDPEFDLARMRAMRGAGS